MKAPALLALLLVGVVSAMPTKKSTNQQKEDLEATISIKFRSDARDIDWQGIWNGVVDTLANPIYLGGPGKKDLISIDWEGILNTIVQAGSQPPWHLGKKQALSQEAWTDYVAPALQIAQILVPLVGRDTQDVDWSQVISTAVQVGTTVLPLLVGKKDLISIDWQGIWNNVLEFSNTVNHDIAMGLAGKRKLSQEAWTDYVAPALQIAQILVPLVGRDTQDVDWSQVISTAVQVGTTVLPLLVGKKDLISIDWEGIWNNIVDFSTSLAHASAGPGKKELSQEAWTDYVAPALQIAQILVPLVGRDVEDIDWTQVISTAVQVGTTVLPLLVGKKDLISIDWEGIWNNIVDFSTSLAHAGTGIGKKELSQPAWMNNVFSSLCTGLQQTVGPLVGRDVQDIDWSQVISTAVQVGTTVLPLLVGKKDLISIDWQGIWNAIVEAGSQPMYIGAGKKRALSQEAWTDYVAPALQIAQVLVPLVGRDTQDVDWSQVISTAVQIGTTVLPLLVGKKDLISIDWEGIWNNIVDFGNTLTHTSIGKKELSQEAWTDYVAPALQIAQILVPLVGRDVEDVDWTQVISTAVQVGTTVLPLLVGKKDLISIDWEGIWNNIVDFSTSLVQYSAGPGKKELSQEAWTDYVAPALQIAQILVPLVGRDVEDVDWTQVISTAFQVGTTVSSFIVGKKDLISIDWQGIWNAIVDAGSQPMTILPLHL